MGVVLRDLTTTENPITRSTVFKPSGRAVPERRVVVEVLVVIVDAYPKRPQCYRPTSVRTAMRRASSAVIGKGAQTTPLFDGGEET
jgi:hypothetical protein